MLARAQTEERTGPAADPHRRLAAEAPRQLGQALWLAHRKQGAGVILRDATPDTGCGLKVFRRDAFLEIPHFDHMHRFLPALFIRQGGRVISVARQSPAADGRAVQLQQLAAAARSASSISIGMYWLQRRWRGPEIDGQIIEPPVAATSAAAESDSLDAKSSTVETCLEI